MEQIIHYYRTIVFQILILIKQIENQNDIYLNLNNVEKYIDELKKLNRQQ